MTSETFAQLFPLFCLLLGLASLAVFGVAWNAYVARQEAHGADEGRTWLYVVIGCAVTQAVAGLVDLALDWNAGVLGFLCFAASGVPMIVGALQRHEALRKRFLGLIKEVADGRKTTGQ